MELLDAELSKAVDDKEMEDGGKAVESRELVPALLESSEPEKVVKRSKYNLRKSLAWDNAFFTNAGMFSIWSR